MASVPAIPDQWTDLDPDGSLRIWVGADDLLPAGYRPPVEWGFDPVSGLLRLNSRSYMPSWRIEAQLDVRRHQAGETLRRIDTEQFRAAVDPWPGREDHR